MHPSAPHAVVGSMRSSLSQKRCEPTGAGGGGGWGALCPNILPAEQTYVGELNGSLACATLRSKFSAGPFGFPVCDYYRAITTGLLRLALQQLLYKK